ncbi:Ataxin-3 [Blattella germanica]|nr:Ataxin-3 [Blattella germanica]
MEVIFHEKQEGSLCAQHCLNALLQGSYFTPVDLASLAQQMDDEERIRMAESGVDTEEYRRFLEQPSGNYDDSGYFSVQVISSALEVWGLELVPYNSTEPRALEAQQCPEAMQAFICNYRDHWFTIRRLGYQWFNLNSLLTGPELISDTYLAMFLAQLQQEGYSIFVVFGPFPECDADTLLRIVPAVQTVKPRLLASAKSNNASNMGSSQNKSSEEDLQRAIKLSLGAQEELPPGQAGCDSSRSSNSYQASGSNGCDSECSSNGMPEVRSSTNLIDAEDVRRKRLAYLEANARRNTPTNVGSAENMKKQVNT